MRKNKTPEITWRQLCAIVRETYDPSAAEWKEKSKCRIVAIGYAIPTPHVLASAFDAIERVHNRQTKTPAPRIEQRPPDVAPLSREESITALQAIQRRSGITPAPRPMPEATGELLTTRQRYAIVHAIEKIREAARRKADA